jgi:MoxR-like ATPase
MESMEFKGILNDIQQATVTKQVNSRFKIYYGSQGTGKTTQAMNETDNLCIVCNSSMLPSDLMEDFTFSDGKATFNPSALCRCMEEGKPIVLDEINLLPFDSLRFLQGIFDGKTEFQYKGQTVHIKDGFKVIGTMNLVVNGVSFGLPEPLVDRCEDIKEFTLTAEMLMNAF